jgi:hypothetical protein
MGSTSNSATVLFASSRYLGLLPGMVPKRDASEASEHTIYSKNEFGDEVTLAFGPKACEPFSESEMRIACAATLRKPGKPSGFVAFPSRGLCFRWRRRRTSQINLYIASELFEIY